MNYRISPEEYHRFGRWAEAKMYCFSLEIDGKTGWRLPTRAEQLHMGLHWHCHNGDMQPNYDVPRHIIPVIDNFDETNND